MYATRNASGVIGECVISERSTLMDSEVFSEGVEGPHGPLAHRIFFPEILGVLSAQGTLGSCGRTYARIYVSHF